MSQRKNILVIGRHADMLSKIVAQLQSNGYDAQGSLGNDEAVTTFQLHRFDAVIIGGGVDITSRNFFRTEFLKLRPEVKIIDAHPQTVLSDLKAAFT